MIINGEPKGFIKPSQGIQQGDLSLYLFLLCAKGLSSMLRQATETNQMQGILSYRGGIHISHLLFANDSLLFCQAKRQECQNLLHILVQYEEASGQAINRQKTTFFFSRNTSQEVKKDIRTILGAQIMTDCEQYLGLPMVGGKSKVGTFKEILEQITKRVMGSKEKDISKAGREILIKTVAQAIPTYSMSIFRIPKAVCDGINSLLEKYWWGQTQNEKKIH